MGNEQQNKPPASALPEGVRPQDVYVILAADEHDMRAVSTAARKRFPDARRGEDVQLARLSDVTAVVVAFIPPPDGSEVPDGAAIKAGAKNPPRDESKVRFTEPLHVGEFGKEYWRQNIHGDGVLNLAPFLLELGKRIVPMTIKQKSITDGILRIAAA